MTADRRIEIDDPEPRLEHEVETAVSVTNFQIIDDLAITLAADPAKADPQSDQIAWMEIGPRNIGGRIRALVQDPSNPRILYAGSGHGSMWKTEDAGDTWRPLGTLRHASKEVATPIGAIGLCHHSPNVLYVGTGEPIGSYFAGHGLFHSSDGGATFRQIADENSGPIASRRFERILVDPWERGRAWIAAPTGLWRTDPGNPPAPRATQDTIDGATTGVGGLQDVTDIAIDFGDRSSAAPPATFLVYAAVRADGVYFATFDRATNDYRITAGNRWQRALAYPAAGGGRTKVALCEGSPANVYVLFEGNGGTPTRVHRSQNGAAGPWRAMPTNAGSPGVHLDGSIGWFALTLEVHPSNPRIVIAGSVDLFRSTNAGGGWTRVLNGNQYRQGDRAQHADQHAVMFDRADPARVWVANDGGISLLDTATTRWRKRSHGILATQFYDIAIHPSLPSMTGGGLLDNGSWVGYGGPTWHILAWGDGGAMAMDIADPQRFWTQWQGDSTHASSLWRTSVVSVANPAAALPGVSDQRNPMPDVGNDVMSVRNTDLLNNFNGADGNPAGGVFGGRMIAHPSTANDVIVARKRGAFRTTNGTVFNLLRRTGGVAGDPDPSVFGGQTDVTAIAYAPADANNTFWIGDDTGRLFRTKDGGATWRSLAAPAMAGLTITEIAVHPRNLRILAVTIGGTVPTDPQVLVSHDEGATWKDVSEQGAADRRLPPGAVSCARWDPRAGAAPAAVDQPQTLYLGTAAGVWVARDLRVDQANPQPTWRHLTSGMPLVLVQDLELTQQLDAGGAVIRNIMRCATFGRGLFELELEGTPSVRLLVRSTVIDDGRSYPPAQTITFDPRRRAGVGGARSNLVWHQAFDLRVDTPANFDFGDRFDGVEFDEEMRSGLLRLGESNRIFVQVHNTGRATADDVNVRLYFASATRDGAGNVRAPDLQADFWAGYPNPPAPGSVWQEAAFATFDGLGSAAPRVVLLRWTSPPDLARDVALLAIVDHAGDAIDTASAPVRVDARNGAGALAQTERRAALRIVQSDRAIHLRDAVDDAGLPGSVAWGGRSNDIVVIQAAQANPNAAFANVADRRLADRVQGGVTNHIYVRVFNRRTSAVQARVRLLEASYPGITPGSAWRQLGTQTVNLPASAARFTNAITWADPPDPAPGQAYKAVLLIALVSVRVAAGTDELDPEPDRNEVTDLASFWRFFNLAERANNAAFRAVRWQP